MHSRQSLLKSVASAGGKSDIPVISMNPRSGRRFSRPLAAAGALLLPLVWSVFGVSGAGAADGAKNQAGANSSKGEVLSSEAKSKLAASPFYGQVRKNFGQWDLDQSGDLSLPEIELAVHNPGVKGESAAAAASLRRAVRGDKSLPPLSLEKIAGGVVTPSTKDMPQPKYESMYETGLKKIRETNRDLFADGPPRLESISQGRLGDCFLIVSMGTCAYCDPQRLMNMMRMQPSGKVLVTLGSGRQFELEAPTDGEVIIGATSKNTGCWTNAYEKAVGTVMLERAQEKKTTHVTPLSLIGVGGTPNVPLEILTGHKVRRHGCEDYRQEKDANGASAEDLQPLRDDLKAAFAEKRLIVGGCGPKGKQALVKGIYYNHSYGVLEYDEATDTVLFWNPFGHKFTPKGPDGLEHGYTTTNGKFRVPLKEAVMWYGSFSIETAEPSGK
ncbi:MAG: hypothetical protein C0478_02640 [Planctomyces sp.]|nr:hypothetical protein [Planctomyces sp.]